MNIDTNVGVEDAISALIRRYDAAAEYCRVSKTQKILTPDCFLLHRLPNKKSPHLARSKAGASLVNGRSCDCSPQRSQGGRPLARFVIYATIKTRTMPA